jgi:type IV fimbrial biogenesis protein FimT
VELMVTVAIVGLLLVLGVPTMRGVIENSRIRTAAESWQYGLTLARNEAVRRNARIQFVTSADGWVVSLMDNTVLHSGSGQEGAANLAVTITLVDGTVLTPNDATRVTYNSFGRVLDPNPDLSPPIAVVDIESANPSNLASYRPLQLQLLAGGLSRLCDPALADTDPRACL